MTDKKITQLNNITGANLADADEFVVVDISADETMAVTRAELFLSVPAITVDGDVTFGANANFGDTGRAIFGAGSDLQIFHNGSNSYVQDNGTGILIVQGSTGVHIQGRNATDMIRANEGSAVELYFNNVKKLVTSSTGVNITGNVGIGTTSPDTPIEVQTATANSAYVRVGSTFSSSSWTSGDDIAGLEFRGNDASGAGVGVKGSIRYKVMDTLSANTAMTFHTAGTSAGSNDVERMRIEKDGNLNLGGLLTNSFPANNTSGAGISLRADGRISSVAESLATLNLGRHTSVGDVVQFYFNGSPEGSISISSTATSYNTSSDYRLKTDAQPMTGASTRVQALNPVNFEWLSDGSRVDGFLAHEAQAVVPESVTGTQDAMQDEEYEVTAAEYETVVVPAIEAADAVYDDEGGLISEAVRGQEESTCEELVSEAVMGTRSVPDYQRIDQSKLVPLLTAALQEALTKIDAMETRLTALEE